MKNQTAPRSTPIWVVIAVTAAGWFFVSNLAAHEFEDGFIDRSVSVFIRDRIVTIEYSVGCNPVTMQHCLDKWKSQSKTRTESSSAVIPRVDESLESQFQSALLAFLSTKIEVACDDQAIPVKPLSVAASPRHHVSAVGTLQFELPDGDSLKLVIRDPLFSEQSGEARYAAKSFGNAILARTNVAPTLVRASRIHLTGLSGEQRQEKTKIDCHVVFASSDDDYR